MRRRLRHAALLGILLLLVMAQLGISGARADELVEAGSRGIELFRAERYEAALPHFRRALELAEARFGADSPAIAVELNNLAEVYRLLGRHDEALPLYERALALDRRQEQVDPVGLATTLNNLALTYRAQGRLDEAEPLYLRSLELLEEALGNNHPDIAKSLNNLAVLYRQQGRPERARPLLERALGIARRSLGGDHPTRTTLERNLATLDDELGGRAATAAELEPAADAATTANAAASAPRQGGRDGRFFIHLASVRSAEAARAEWRRLAEHLDLPQDLRQRPPERVDIEGKGTFYRVAGGHFATRAAAAELCARIEAEDQYCAVMTEE